MGNFFVDIIINQKRHIFIHYPKCIRRMYILHFVIFDCCKNAFVAFLRIQVPNKEPHCLRQQQVTLVKTKTES